MVEIARELSGVSLTRTLILFMGLHPHDLVTSKAYHLQILLRCRRGLQPVGVALRDTDSQHAANNNERKTK